MSGDERTVREATRDFLKDRGWFLYGGKKGVDVRATRALDGVQHVLLLEAKGDVGETAANPVGQRLKYVQHALGQLVARTGPQEYGYGPTTLLAAAFPTPCRGGTEFYVETLRAKVSTELRSAMRLCLLFVHPDRTVTLDLPASVDTRLFGLVS